MGTDPAFLRPPDFLRILRGQSRPAARPSMGTLLLVNLGNTPPARRRSSRSSSARPGRTLRACAGRAVGVTLPDVGEPQDANNAGRVPERVTIAEAATLLGCHPNTVRSRVKTGMYSAEKVLTERGPTWMIDRDSLTTNGPTNARQHPVGVVPPAQSEALQELARAIVREAGVVQDPDENRDLESTKMTFDRSKTQVLLISGVLVGAVALSNITPSGPGSFGLLGWAITAVTFCIGLSFAHMLVLSALVKATRVVRLSSRKLQILDTILDTASFLAFMVAITILVGWVVLQW